MPVVKELYANAISSSSDSGNTSIFNTNYTDTRSEILILKKDLEDAGIQKGDKLLDLSFFVTSKSGKNLSNVKIGIKHTTGYDAISENYFETYDSHQEVYIVSSINRNSIIANEWFTFTFNSGFIWNGNDNISLTLIADGSGAGTSGGQWLVKSVSGSRYLGYRANNTSKSPFDSVSGTIIKDFVPSMKITIDDRITPKLTTNGLVGYWNSREGVVDDINWNNISPNTKGKYNAIISGAKPTSSGMYYDGVDDYIDIPLPLELQQKTSATIEFIIKSENSWIGQEIISQYSTSPMGDYLMYIYGGYVVLSGIFDSIRTEDDMMSLGEGLLNEYSTYLITITADTLSSKITCYIYNLDEMTLISNSYTTNISTISENNFFRIGSYNTPFMFKGMMDNIRLYNRVLTDNEILQNRALGFNVGLEYVPPKVNYLLANKKKISPKQEMNQSIITVRFDVDVVEYVARLNGSDYSTGILVHQGGAVLANTDAEVIIDWDELSSEGDNRINIYGKSNNGVWTEYQN